ncbi:SMI1/KNR4 family protein [Brevundimonas lenta]|uniref:SMI1/KNR4 family protein n=1 Tax=Brevundimonas lenta TaxID=424796 RepID=A0A7W6NNG5_9CAUL|nr:SMI1/KNR4 family protein [Brevundimonas lenta]MBB4081439.1 hypothetical protein [Brevundimonas lenta]
MTPLTWTHGYSAVELERAQERFRLTFPPDLIELLRDRRPVGGPDWNDEGVVRPLLAWPYEGLLFDVEDSGLWWTEWGDRPDRAEERAEILRDVLSRAPRLIPIFSHRYLPATPCDAGNPVFSVYQSDVIHYGADLGDYIDREENGSECQPWPETFREIDFWSELVRRNNLPPLWPISPSA